MPLYGVLLPHVGFGEDTVELFRNRYDDFLELGAKCE
jgi:hypothetical protein